MGDIRGFDHLGQLKLAARRADVVEQAVACAEQYRYQVEMDLVQEVRAQQLLGDAGAVHEKILFPLADAFAWSSAAAAPPVMNENAPLVMTRSSRAWWVSAKAARLAGLGW